LAFVDGEWKQVRNPNPPIRGVSPAAIPEGNREQGQVSVDGAWLALVEGQWKRVGFVTPSAPARPGRSIPEGSVSVDGALPRVEVPAEETEAA